MQIQKRYLLFALAMVGVQKYSNLSTCPFKRVNSILNYLTFYKTLNIMNKWFGRLWGFEINDH